MAGIPQSSTTPRQPRAAWSAFISQKEKCQLHVLERKVSTETRVTNESGDDPRFVLSSSSATAIRGNALQTMSGAGINMPSLSREFNILKAFATHPKLNALGVML